MTDNISKSHTFNSGINHSTLSSSIIITPYEKVLSILNKVKQYINMTSKCQSKLVRSLDWVIKVITSHSLYAYELKEKDLINKLSKENINFKNFVDFVSKYNEQVIEMNKKNIKLDAKTIEVANDLLQKPSINLKKPIVQKTVTPIKKKIRKIKLIKNNKFNEEESNKYINGKYKKYSVNILDNNEPKLNRLNTFNTSKIGIQKFSKSGKNLRFEKISLTSKLGNPQYIVKKKSDGIRETKTFYIDMNQFNSPKHFEYSSKNNAFTSNKDSLEHNLYSNSSNEIEIFNIFDDYRKSTNLNIKERFSLPFAANYNTLSLMNLQGMLNLSIFNTK